MQVAQAFDLGEFGKQLEKKGFKLANPDLTLAQDVPSNGAMLVVDGANSIVEFKGAGDAWY